MQSLHEQLLDLRMPQFAHTDHSFYRPKVAMWPCKDRPHFPMSFKGYDYAALDQRIQEVEALVKAVETRLAKRLTELENHLYFLVDRTR
jgi:hypothetical protein